MAFDRVIQTDEKLPVLQAVPLSLQHLMAMFGATVLVPILTGLDPGVGLMTSGIGTILYLIITRNKIPSYLGSSFAFITPLIAVGGGAVAIKAGGGNLPAALGGLVAAGVVYMIVAAIVKVFGTGWLTKILPPALVGAVVIVIGLALSATAVKMALGMNYQWVATQTPITILAKADPNAAPLVNAPAGTTIKLQQATDADLVAIPAADRSSWQKVALEDGTAGFIKGADPAKDFSAPSAFNMKFLIVAGIALLAAIAFSSYFKGFLRTIPILLGIIVGFLAAIPLGLVSFAGLMSAGWIGLPNITFPSFDPAAIAIIAPVAFVVIVEHIGHLLVINEITGKDFTPMLPESLFGDGIATAISGALGGTPSTTYAENIGVMAVTKVYATQLFWYAGAFAFVIGGFVPKLSAAISAIPEGVMGGISLLLFGLIASSGLRLLVKSGIDFSHSRNLIMCSVVLVVGIGMETSGAAIPLGRYTVPGMALATLLGVILNLILPKESEGLAIDSPDFTATSQEEAAE